MSFVLMKLLGWAAQAVILHLVERYALHHVYEYIDVYMDGGLELAQPALELLVDGCRMVIHFYTGTC